MSHREPLTALTGALREELTLATGISGLDPQFHRRLIVRVMFSVFEGYAFHIRQRALEVGQAKDYEFTAADLEVLTEQADRKKADGSTESVERRLSSWKALSASTDVFAKVMGVSPPASRPVAALKAGFGVRDRLTHPKTASAFVVTDEEANIVAGLATWFSEMATWYTTTELAHIEAIRESTSRSIKEQIDAIANGRTWPPF